jgi:hypothetical protein
MPPSVVIAETVTIIAKKFQMFSYTLAGASKTSFMAIYQCHKNITMYDVTPTTTASRKTVAAIET